jgi:hypothetical protein
MAGTAVAGKALFQKQAGVHVENCRPVYGLKKYSLE